MQYICYIWKYNEPPTAALSNINECLKTFRSRIELAYPISQDYHHRYSEFEEIY